MKTREEMVKEVNKILETMSWGDAVGISDPTQVRYNDETIDEELRKISRNMAAIGKAIFSLSSIYRYDRKILAKDYIAAFNELRKDQEIPKNSLNIQTEKHLEAEGEYDGIRETEDVIAALVEAKDTLTRVEMNYKKMRGPGPDFGQGSPRTM